MKRELKNHRFCGGLNDALNILVMDDPGRGGACHEYAITFRDEKAGYDRSPISEKHGRNCIISFQNGPISEVGVNGISIEALLAIVEDRLDGFQGGEFAVDENKEALVHVQKAMGWLRKRTLDRQQRGAEGMYQK